MSNYENWQLEKYGSIVPENLPYNEHLEDTREIEVKECLYPNMETGGRVDDEFVPTPENE